MRFPSLLAVVIVCLSSAVSYAQWFPNAPWNRAANQAGCYTNSVGQTICPSAPMLQTNQAAIYPSVSSNSMAYSNESFVNYGSFGGTASASVNSSSMGSTGGVSVTAAIAPDPNEMNILARRSGFRQSLMEAAREAHDRGLITDEQLGELRIKSLRPKVLAGMQTFVHETAMDEGLASAQAPDWGAIIDFIERLIPLIIKLIDLFGVNDLRLNEVQYVNAESYEGYLRWDTSFGLAT